MTSGNSDSRTLSGLDAADFAPAARAADRQLVTRPSLSYWQDAWRRLRQNGQALASLGLIVALLLFTLAGPWLWRVDPSGQELARISEGPTFGRTLRVIAEPGPFTPVIRSDVPARPAHASEGAKLAAPTLLETLDTPSQLGVRFRWAPVPGADGYAIYRNVRAPRDNGTLGVPLQTIDGGNQVSYEDTFDLKPGTYYYSVVALGGGVESERYATVPVPLEPGIGLTDAKSYDANAQVGRTVRLPGRPLGTDYLGRDVLARLIAGARVSLYIGFVAPLLYVALGIVLGGMSGFFGGKVDEWIMRFCDFILALPFLLFMILFKVAFGAGPGQNGISSMMLALVVLSWTGAARLTRGQILQLRESEFVQAARLMGARPAYLILRHLLPNTLGVILVELTFAVPVCIFTEAFLSFIGMGVVPPTPSWGSMCNDGIKTFLTFPHEFLAPALMISVTVLAFNLLGDGLRDALDPKMRGRS